MTVKLIFFRNFFPVVNYSHSLPYPEIDSRGRSARVRYRVVSTFLVGVALTSWVFGNDRGEAMCVQVQEVGPEENESGKRQSF